MRILNLRPPILITILFLFSFSVSSTHAQLARVPNLELMPLENHNGPLIATVKVKDDTSKDKANELGKVAVAHEERLGDVSKHPSMQPNEEYYDDWRNWQIRQIAGAEEIMKNLHEEDWTTIYNSIEGYLTPEKGGAGPRLVHKKPYYAETDYRSQRDAYLGRKLEAGEYLLFHPAEANAERRLLNGEKIHLVIEPIIVKHSYDGNLLTFTDDKVHFYFLYASQGFLVNYLHELAHAIRKIRQEG